MFRWKSETGANGTCYWVNLPNNIEIVLFKKNINNSTYSYILKWNTDNGMDYHWKEPIAAENWEDAKEKAVKKTNKIISSYLTELKDVLEVLNGESKNCSLG